MLEGLNAATEISESGKPIPEELLARLRQQKFYSEDQPRVPMGESGGGEFTKGEAGIPVNASEREFHETVNGQLRSLPPEHIAGIASVRVINFIPGDHASAIELKRAGFTNVATAGIYEPKDHTIIVRHDMLDEDVLIHEVGHHVQETLLTKEEKSEWASLKGTAKISAYARKDANEHFAEAYRCYFGSERLGTVISDWTDRETLRQLEPKAFAFMERLKARATPAPLPSPTGKMVKR